jgi:invasion protein IalB
MSMLVKLNYAIAFAVVLLGFIASYMTYQRQDIPQKKSEQAEILRESAAPKIAVTAPSDASGEWRYECKLSLEGMEECSALRRVMWEDGKSEALVAVLSMAKREGTPTPRMKLMAPLGSFLPAGVSMRIDQQDPFIVPFQACAVEGCFVNLDLAPDVIAAMTSGALMVVEYMTPEQKIATVTIPLAGVDDVLQKIAK